MRDYIAIPNICAGLGFTYETENHSVNFVDNVSGANIQIVERIWFVIKSELRKKGTAHNILVNLVRKIYIYRFKLLHRKST